MKYNLLLSHKFDKDFSQLEKSLQDRVVESLRELNENPHAGKRLRGKLKDLLSWRVGKYRIIISNTGRKATGFCHICTPQKACI